MGAGPPYLTLMTPDAPQRTHDLREVYNARRWLARTGPHWRMMPHVLPPWPTVYQQMRRRLTAGVFEAIVHDLRVVLRIAGREPTPSAAILDARTVQSTPGSGARAGDDSDKKRKGSTMHVAVDTLSHLLARRRMSRNVPMWASWRLRCKRPPARVWRSPSSIRATLVTHLSRQRTPHSSAWRSLRCRRPSGGVVLLPRRWVVERDFAWSGRFRRLARDYERFAETLAGYHLLAFALLMLHKLVTLLVIV